MIWSSTKAIAGALVSSMRTPRSCWRTWMSKSGYSSCAARGSSEALPEVSTASAQRRSRSCRPPEDASRRRATSSRRQDVQAAARVDVGGDGGKRGGEGNGRALRQGSGRVVHAASLARGRGSGQGAATMQPPACARPRQKQTAGLPRPFGLQQPMAIRTGSERSATPASAKSRGTDWRRSRRRRTPATPAKRRCRGRRHTCRW